jgi:hypothetical protein
MEVCACLLRVDCSSRSGGRRYRVHAYRWRFTQVPTIYSYQALIGLVPKAARTTWHDKAIEAAVPSDAPLSALLPLLVARPPEPDLLASTVR